MVCVPRVGLADPADRGAGRHERLLVDVAADRAHAGDRADRRDRGEPLADLLLDLDRHHVAAVRVGADRHRLHLERAQAGALAAAHIGVERRLVLACVVTALLRSAASGGRACFTQRRSSSARIDARDLLFQQRIGATALDCGKALVIAFLVRLEDAHHIVGARDLSGNTGLLLRRVGENLHVHMLLLLVDVSWERAARSLPL